MEAPKKIYLTKNLLGELRDGWDALPSEVFTNIEYTRTDAFIEKALNFLDGSIPDYIKLKHANVDTFMDVDNERFIKDFINYMKGE